MSLEPSAMPISGSIFLAAIVYAATAFWAGGSIIGPRVIENSNFIPRCEQAIIEHTKQEVPELQSAPVVPDCNSVMGMFLGAESQSMCALLDPLMQNPMAGQIEAQNRRLTEAHDDRIARAANRANSQCSCAVNVQLENSVPWALFAGSFRVHVPPKIRNLDAELFAALKSPVCSGEFQ